MGARTNWKEKYDKEFDRNTALSAEISVWRERALLAEQHADKIQAQSTFYLQSLKEAQSKIEELKTKIPVGPALTYIENLIETNKTYRKLLVGEPVGLWLKLRHTLPLIFKRSG
jgi:hypothetical protein